MSGENNFIDPLTSLKLVLLLLVPYISIASRLAFLKKPDGLILHFISICYVFLPRLLIFLLVISLFEQVIPRDVIRALLLITLLSTFYVNAKVISEKTSIFYYLLLTAFQVFLFLLLLIATVILFYLITGYEVEFFK